jgi:hypothetical protein
MSRKTLSGSTVKPIMEIKTEDKDKIDDERFGLWMNDLYKLDMKPDEVHSIYENLRYQGFERSSILKGMMLLNLTKRLLIELIIVCALRGPIQAAKTALSNGSTPIAMGIPANGGKGTKTLTCGRISAATADLAAYYLKLLNVPKRIPSIDLPGWLQFLAAGSINLNSNLRDKHKEFSKEFSKIIGGSFNEQIYHQMTINSYLDLSLNLFN